MVESGRREASSVRLEVRWATFRRNALFVLAAVVAVAALMKGFARAVHPYAVSQYQYTYERGFLIRALPGEAVRAVCRDDVQCLRSMVEGIGTLSVLAFTVVLLAVARHRAAFPTGFLALAVVASGPLLVQIGAGRGYHDALVLALGLLAYRFFTPRRWWLAAGCFGLALLVHEMVAVYVLPLFVLPLLAGGLKPTREKLLLLGVIVVLAATTFGVVTTGRATPAQNRHLVRKLERSHAELSGGWRGYVKFGKLAARKRPDALRPKRLARLTSARNLPYLVPSLVMLGASVVALAVRRRFLAIPLYATLAVLPVTVLLVAWDVDRLSSLTGVTALFVCIAVLREVKLERAPVWLTAGALVLVAVQLFQPYDVVRRYARGQTLLEDAPVKRHRSKHRSPRRHRDRPARDAAAAPSQP